VLRNSKEKAYLKWIASRSVLLSELSRQATATGRVLQDNDNVTVLDRNGSVCRQELNSCVKWSLAVLGLFLLIKSVWIFAYIFMCILYCSVTFRAK